MQNIYKQFPILNDYTYLNTASSGLISTDVKEWRRKHDDQLWKEGSIFRDRHRSHIESIKKTVSRFFGSELGEVALVPNFSLGLNTVIEGLPQKQKVLLLKHDYPSINWAFENRDFDVCYANIDEKLEANIEEAVNIHQPDIFAFSIVQYLSGIKIDLDFLKRLKAYHPNLLLIGDGTQYLGTEEFSFTENAIDILGSSAYKWLLGGYGNGFFMIKEYLHQQIFPSTIGFNSAEATYSKRDEVTFISRFEPGHQDTLNYGSLEQSILNLEKIGLDVISQRIDMLTKLAREGLNDLGLLDDSVLKREQHSSIYNIKGDEQLFKKLQKNRIIGSLRGGGIRLSFHYYNSEQDLDNLFNVLR